VVESSFVAGEIDVPTPPPSPARLIHDTPAVEFTAAAPILGSPDDPDTGSRTPPADRRSAGERR
jgi:hypothetical protein